MSDASMPPERLAATAATIPRLRAAGMKNHNIAEWILADYAADRNAMFAGSDNRLIETIALALNLARSRPTLPLKTNHDVAASIVATFVSDRDAKKEGFVEQLIENITKALNLGADSNSGFSP